MNPKLQEIRAKREALRKEQREKDNAKWYTKEHQEWLKKDREENWQDSVCTREVEGALDDPIVNRDDALKIYSRLNLGYEYTGMTNDGTQRKVWTLVDPNKDIVGTMITTADKRLMKTNPKGPWDETFSYMNIIGYDEEHWDFNTYLPKTVYYHKYFEKSSSKKK